MTKVLAIILGGGIGALGRYAFMTLFPYSVWTTVGVNFLGCFILGVFIELSAIFWSPSETLKLFVVIGVLGSFTTFSTFSLDAVTLLTRGDFLKASLYILMSVLLSIIGLYLGLTCIRFISL